MTRKTWVNDLVPAAEVHQDLGFQVELAGPVSSDSSVI